MSRDPDRPFLFVNPRPGVVYTLGVFHVVMSIAISTCVSLSTGYYLVASVMTPPMIQVQQVAPTPAPVVTTPPAATAAPAVAGAAVPKQSVVSSTITMNPMMGMDEPSAIRFFIIDLVTALIVNIAMFTAGIGLINLKPWGRRWSNWVAWIKIFRLVLLWSGFMFLVSPAMSESMANNVLRMIPPNGAGRGPNAAVLKQVYLIMSLIASVVMIGVGVIYPVVSLWVASRPGFRAAFSAPTKDPMWSGIQP